MSCPTCEGPVPENDDRFLPYCSENCQKEALEQVAFCLHRPGECDGSCSAPFEDRI